MPGNEVSSVPSTVIQEVRRDPDDNNDDELYHCIPCDLYLQNVMSHIKKNHKSQSVIIKSLDNEPSLSEVNNEVQLALEDTKHDSETVISHLQVNEGFTLESEKFEVVEEDFLNIDATEDELEVSVECVVYDQDDEKDLINQDSSSNEIISASDVKDDLEHEFIANDILPSRISDTDAISEDEYSNNFMEIIEIDDDLIEEDHYDEIISQDDNVLSNNENTSSTSRTKEGERYELHCINSCDQTFSTIYAYKHHVKNWHPEENKANNDGSNNNNQESYLCITCHTHFPTSKSLSLHQKMHVVPVKNVTLEHATKYSSTKLREYFSCDLCQKKFDISLQDEHRKFHDNDDEKLVCYKCNRDSFRNKIDYDLHMKLHESESRFEKPTKRLTKAEKMGIKLPYECQYCERSFSRPHEKVKHERIHTGEKPYKCEVCGKMFRVSYSLTLHLRTHSDDRPYVCTFKDCNKSFKALGVYSHHLLTHSEERHYACDQCPKRFKTGVQLHGHKNSHAKPFSCPECNRRFASMSSVRSHLETHKRSNTGRKHKCSLCGALYARAFALKDHLKEVHDIDDVYKKGYISDKDENNVNFYIEVTDNNEKIPEENYIEANDEIQHLITAIS